MVILGGSKLGYGWLNLNVQYGSFEDNMQPVVFQGRGDIVATGGESSNWTRDASNPAGQEPLLVFQISTGFGALWTS